MVYPFKYEHVSGELPWLYNFQIYDGRRIRDEYFVILEQADKSEDVRIQFAIDASLILHMPVLMKCLPLFRPKLTVCALRRE